MTPRQEQLKKLIQTSPVLTDLERQDWLDMLELMNDKQLSDLENILQTPVSRAKPDIQASAGVAKPAGVPAGLSHIANLPTGVNLKAAPKPAPAPNNRWLDEMKLVMSEKELPAPRVQPKTPQQAMPKPVTSELPSRPAPAVRPETEPVRPAEIEVDTGPRAPENWEPKSAEDAALLSVAIYRNLGAQKLLALLQALVKKVGYAKVLVALEKSHLHKAYVAAGHNFLVAGVDEAKTVVSKKEFEEIADIFLKIQVN